MRSTGTTSDRRSCWSACSEVPLCSWRTCAGASICLYGGLHGGVLLWRRDLLQRPGADHQGPVQRHHGEEHHRGGGYPGQRKHPELSAEGAGAAQPGLHPAVYLLDKPERRVKPVEVHYSGFTIPDAFVVGYGLDYAEHYRNLPYIGILKPEVYGAEPERLGGRRPPEICDPPERTWFS